MKIIIFAGGSGKRFWPVSRQSSPKQFLNVVGEIPLIRMAYNRVHKKLSEADIFVSTGQKFGSEVKRIISELPDDNLILEPDMRDTGPAVTLAVSYVHKKFPEEVIACIWSDHLVKDEVTFMESLFEAEQLVKDENKIVFVAVPARFANIHRGYIHFGSSIKLSKNSKIKLLQFKRFEEKPNLPKATEFIEDGNYGWNPGYWVFKGEAFLKKIKSTSPEIFNTCQKVIDDDFSRTSMQEFAALDKISADYIFAEKVYSSQGAVVFADFGWSDIGEWISLKEALEKSHKGNVVKGNVADLGSEDTLIYNYEDKKLVATIGLKGYVVVNTPDVVAIFPGENNQKLKELLKGFENSELEKYL